MKISSGERLETQDFSGTTVEHLHRYSIVNDYIKNKVVLDIASGEGYGSNLMAESATKVYGVDIDEISINLSRKKYIKDNLEFIRGSTSKIPLNDNSVDVVVSFETIEHHDEHLQMLNEIKRVLKFNGLLIISTPDKYYYSDVPNYKNKFHIKELYKDEFHTLVGSFFRNIQLLNQHCINGNSIIDDSEFPKLEFVWSGNYDKVFEKSTNPLFLIIIASDDNYLKQKISFFDGSLIYKKILDEHFRIFKSGKRYKIGNSILKPFDLIKNIFK